jgi:DNA-binding transcriptional ArsR family regulator
MSTEVDWTEPAETLRVLAHPLRLRLLAELAGGELAVGEIEARTGIGQPLLSQQLALLRGARLVQTRRAARQIFYSVSAEALRTIAAKLGHLAGEAAKPPPSRRAVPGATMFARVG